METKRYPISAKARTKARAKARSSLMSDIEPVLGLVEVLLGELLHLNTLLSHGNFLLGNHLGEGIVLHRVSDALNPNVSLLLTRCRHSENKPPLKTV